MIKSRYDVVRMRFPLFIAPIAQNPVFFDKRGFNHQRMVSPLGKGVMLWVTYGHLCFFMHLTLKKIKRIIQR